MSSSNQAESIKRIVALLKLAPFARNDTLVSFSQLSPLELLQLTNEVFASLDSKQSRDLRDEPSDQTTHRMIDFLITTLDYHPPGLKDGHEHDDDDGASNPMHGDTHEYDPQQLAEFGQSFISAQPSTIYPVLLYCLTHHATLVKRAYLSKFLSSLSIPNDMLSDPTVVGLLNKYQQLQSDFKSVHQRVDSQRATASQPRSLKHEVEQLENEKDQLQSKLKKLKSKIELESSSSDPQHASQFIEMLRLTNLLRLEQEEENKIYQQKESQQERRAKIELQLSHNRESLQSVRKAHGLDTNHSINPMAIIQRVRDEIASHQSTMQGIEDNQNEKEKEYKNLLKVSNTLSNECQQLSLPLSTLQLLTDDDLVSLQQQKQALNNRIVDLETQISHNVGGNDSALGFLIDRLNAINKKKEKLLKKITELEFELKEIEKEKMNLDRELLLMEQKNAEKQQYSQNNNLPKNEKQFQQYLGVLQAKTQQYKRKKFIYDKLVAEGQTLANTLRVLKTKIQNLDSFNAMLETKRGLSGYRDTVSQLEELTKLNLLTDESKKLSLDEISELIARIDKEIKARKSILAPKIKDLRVVRNQYEEFKTEYLTLKGENEKWKLNFESERVALSREVHDVHESKLLEERTYFSFEIKIKEFLTKKEFYANLYYSDELDKLLREMKKKEKSLLKEKKSLNDNGNKANNQRSAFVTLRQLLRAKWELEEGDAGSATSGPAAEERMVF